MVADGGERSRRGRPGRSRRPGSRRARRPSPPSGSAARRDAPRGRRRGRASPRGFRTSREAATVPPTVTERRLGEEEGGHRERGRRRGDEKVLRKREPAAERVRRLVKKPVRAGVELSEVDSRLSLRIVLDGAGRHLGPLGPIAHPLLGREAGLPTRAQEIARRPKALPGASRLAGIARPECERLQDS